jgi:hypothetical protein
VILIYVLIVVLVLALALWLVSLPKNVPAYTRVGFYLTLIVAALLAVFVLQPA